ncbi:gliding motility-associated C-terminal domain-containing protein, partial [bacterium]|nr:gliding motility-associated C-terminal domain-containing protein [bacterium]
GTSLIFTPVPLFPSGEVHVRLLAAEDLLGNELETPLDWIFFIDIDPPVFWDELPADGSVITIPSPTISVHIADSLSGLNEGSIGLLIEGITYRITDPGVYWDGELLTLECSETGLSWLGGSTVTLCISASDLPDYCEPNVDTFCWEFSIASGGPIAEILEPTDGTTTACQDHIILLTLSDPNGIAASTIQISVGGVLYDITDTNLTFRNDSLFFAPIGGSWPDNDTILVILINAEDSLGNGLEGAPVAWTFYTDFSPPYAFGFTPPDGAEVFNWQEIIQVQLQDRVLGIDSTSITMTIDGVYRAPGSLIFDLASPALSWDGLNLSLDPSLVDDVALGISYLPEEDTLSGNGIYFPEFATIVITLNCAENLPDYCDPQSLASPYSWGFTIPDDDTMPPILSNFAPSAQPTLTPFYIWCDITDPSGIWLDSLYLFWWETSASGYENLSFQTSAYRSDLMIPGFPDTTTVHYTIYCFDDDYDFMNPADRSAVSVDRVVYIQSGPSAAPGVPQQGSISACDDQEIQILLSDDDGIDTNTILLSVNGQDFNINSDELWFETSTGIIHFEPAPGFFLNGQLVEVALLEVSDVLGNPMWDTLTWNFEIDLEAPACSMLYPIPGDMVTNLQTEVRIDILDNLAGVDTSTILFITYNDTFTVSSNGLSWSQDGLGGTLVFDPTAASYWFVQGDTITVTLTAGDQPDYCGSNLTTRSWFFYTQPQISCGIHPNPFTPNNDNYNDIIIFDYPEMFTKSGRLSIFNLRGIKVWESDFDPVSNFTEVLGRSWNGKDTKGISLPEGLYLYSIEIADKNVCNGTLILSR